MKTEPNDHCSPQERGNSTAISGTILGPGKTTGGLTKREYFAAMAMQGMEANSKNAESIDVKSGEAVEMADALIKALNEGSE